MVHCRDSHSLFEFMYVHVYSSMYWICTVAVWWLAWPVRSGTCTWSSGSVAMLCIAELFYNRTGMLQYRYQYSSTRVLERIHVYRGIPWYSRISGTVPRYCNTGTCMPYRYCIAAIDKHGGGVGGGADYGHTGTIQRTGINIAMLVWPYRH